MTAPHSFQVRIYYENTDAGGIVYHASYLGLAERARTEMLRDMGYSHAKKFEQEGIAFAVRTLSIDYSAPAKLDDLLEIKSQVVAIGGASLDLTQDIYKEGEQITAIKVRLVCIDRQGRPQRVPQELRDLFAKGQ